MRPSLKRLILYAAVLSLLMLCATAASFRLTGALKPPVDAAPSAVEVDGLSVPADALAIGGVWEDAAFVHAFPVQNTTSQSVTVDDWIVSCGCVKVAPHPLTIAPGETALVHLTADLTRRLPTQLGLPEREFAYEITPSRAGRDWRHQPRWTFRGVVKSRVTLDVTRLHFGEAPVHGQTGVARVVHAHTHIPIGRLQATIDPKIAKATVAPSPRGPAEFEVLVEINPALSPGPFETSLALAVITPEGDSLPGVSIPVEGEVRPEISPLPARVFFGTRKVGEEVTSDVVLQNPAKSAYSVERIETDSLDVGVKVVPDESGNGTAIRLTQRIALEGQQKSAVRVFLKKRDGVSSAVSIEVSYSGVRDLNAPPAR